MASPKRLLEQELAKELLQRHQAGVLGKKSGFPVFIFDLGGGLKHVLFSSLPGEMIQFD